MDNANSLQILKQDDLIDIIIFFVPKKVDKSSIRYVCGCGGYEKGSALSVELRWQSTEYRAKSHRQHLASVFDLVRHTADVV